MSFQRRFDESHDRSSNRVASRLGVVLLAGFVVASISGCQASSLRERSVKATETDRVAATFSLCRFVPGDRLVYKLEYANHSAADLRPLFADQKAAAKTDATQPGLTQSFQTSVQGEFTASVLSNNGDTAIIAYSLRQPEVSLVINGQNADNDAAQIKAALSQHTYAAVNIQGNILSVRFEPGVNALSQKFVRTLLAMTQFVNPPTGSSGSRKWDTQEADPSGQYLARYEAVPGPSNVAGNDAARVQESFSKTKLRYVLPRSDPASDENAPALEIQPKGRLVAQVDIQRRHLVSLTGAESQTLLLEGKAIGTAESSVQVEELRQQSLSPEELAPLREASLARERVAEAVPLFDTRSQDADEDLIERTELGDATLEGLLSDLGKMETSTAETNETALYLKFKALIHVHPESSASLGKILATADPKSATMRILAGALSVVGHAEATEALVTAIRARPEDWPALTLLIPALGQSHSPTEAAEGVLRDLAFGAHNPDIASTAQLGLGSMARQLAQSAPERVTRIVDVFVKAIESSPSSGAIRLMILALGNAGSSESLPIIIRFINDPSSELRAAALDGLRWIDNEQADALLINALINDRDSFVRQEAAIALGFRKIGDASFKAQKGVFLKERDAKVRLAVLSNLWRANNAFPEVRRIVKEAARSDGSKEVRKAAAEIIAMNH
jgi:HEAT repeats